MRISTDSILAVSIIVVPMALIIRYIIWNRKDIKKMHQRHVKKHPIKRWEKVLLICGMLFGLFLVYAFIMAAFA